MGFDFGENWKEFAANALTPAAVEQARRQLQELLPDELKGKTFLDIGFGQGLSLTLASEREAKTTGIDINPKCAEALEITRNKLQVAGETEIIVGSILDPQVMGALNGRTFDVVHSWGVLHHTGDMHSAMKNAASLVAPRGAFVIAIYNKHITSAAWKCIKFIYCASPQLIRKVMIGLFYPVIALAKALVTGRNPFKMSRGMDFYYNVVDWVGGYPYEYASISEIEEMMAELGFSLKKAIPAQVPTGCNEFVFIRNS